MTKWTRGRHARPIASILCVLMLVSLLLPLSPLPAQAQLANIGDLFTTGITDTTPIIVLDFDNQSSYKTGMLGRVFADAFTKELVLTKTFQVMDRQTVEQLLADENLSLPVSKEAQAMIADRLKCLYTFSGSIDDVRIMKTRDGTFAQVSVSALVVSKVTRMPINGARVIQRSSPKIGFVGNTDMLVHEALSTAAYQVTHKIMENHLPIATVLTSPRGGEVALRGGSTLGLRTGMDLTTIRRESVTGRLRLTSVTPNESYASVIEERGIAPGDKAVPIFTFEENIKIYNKIARERSMQWALGAVSLGLLLTLAGSENGNKDLRAGPTPRPAVLADATLLNHPQGANLIRWSSNSDRVLAWLVYRDTALDIPIAVVPGAQKYYIDSGDALPDITDLAQQDDVTIGIDNATGIVTDYSTTTSYVTDLAGISGTMTVTTDSADVTAVHIPLQPGQTFGYQVRAIFMDYLKPNIDNELSHPAEYQLFIGNKSATSVRVTAVMPPTLVSPLNEQLPLDGIFRCERVPGAMNYILQVSADPNFAPSATVTINGNVESEAYAVASYPFRDLWGQFKSTVDRPVYWRMAAKVDGQPSPRSHSQNRDELGVFSRTSVFLLPAQPPEFRGGHGGVQGIPGKTTTSNHNDRSRLLGGRR